MILLTSLVRRLRRHLRHVSWPAMAGALLAHFVLTWLLFVAAGETRLTGWDAYPYYYMTTATTIGYGDLSPGSTAGRYVAGFWLMPGAVALFASVLAKTSASLLRYWRRHQVGRMDYAGMQGHTIVVGWRGEESKRLLTLLLADTATDDEGVVLLAREVEENPDPEHLRFVATASYLDCEPYARAAIAGAARVIINPGSDDETLAAVFAVMSHAPPCHVVAHFDAPAAARLVHRHYPRVECTQPIMAEVIARAAQDPGSAAITTELLSVEGGPTQFSLVLPGSAPVRTAAEWARGFSAQGALMIGFRAHPEATPRLNPRADEPVPAGAQVYYLADARLAVERVLAAAA